MKDIAERIGQTIVQSGRVQAVFGDPVKLATQTIVPVAAVVTSAGGGAGGLPLLGGGGVGLNMTVVPLGFIHEQDGRVAFTRIELPPELRLERHDRDERGGPGIIQRVREKITEVAGKRAPS